MEVASSNATVLLPRKINRVLEKRALRMTPSGSSKNDEPETSQRFTTSPLVLDVDVPSSSASDITDPSPALLSLTPPPESEKDQNGIPKSNDKNQTATIRRRKTAKKIDLDTQKSRVTRNRDDPNEVVVNNYVDSSEKRKAWPRVVPPNGLKRIPFKPPKGEAEKEKDKLKINMVGPKAKERVAPLEEEDKPASKQSSGINEGPEFQAHFDQFLAQDFQEPTVSIDDYPDREDELMWVDDRKILKDKERELDEAWTAVRRQFSGKVGIDAMLHRLMLCNYDIDQMLVTIEEELYRLPHPFEDFNVGQQTEFERLLQKHMGKSFRSMQERFLKGYYLGEIVQYYYETKHKGCRQKHARRCSCRENMIVEYHNNLRYECYNCTRYIWQNIIPDRSPRNQSYCSVCELYFARRRKHRTPQVPLTEPEEKIARAWIELEKFKEKSVTRNEVFQFMEEKRRENMSSREMTEDIPYQYSNKKIVKLTQAEMIDLSKKFTPTQDPDCWTRIKWRKKVNEYDLKFYSIDQKKAIVKTFQKYGFKPEAVAKELGYNTREIQVFYGRFKDELSLQKLCFPQKKEFYLGHPAYSTIAEPPRSYSSTPEPVVQVNRRKRVAVYDNDPNFEMDRVGPPTKSTRITRHKNQNSACPSGEEIDIEVFEEEAPVV